jgi:hypothetical protein
VGMLRWQSNSRVCSIPCCHACTLQILLLLCSKLQCCHSLHCAQTLTAGSAHRYSRVGLQASAPTLPRGLILPAGRGKQAPMLENMLRDSK